MATLATLTIDLVGKSAKLTAELKKANKQTKSWADRTRKYVNATAKTMTGMGVAGVAAYAAMYAHQADLIDSQVKIADRLGITTEALGGLHHAAEQTGAGVGTLNSGLQRMVRRIGQVAATGKGEAKAALDQLGISIDDIKSKRPDEQFKLIAEKMGDVHNQGQKVFITQKLFDTEGVKLLNTLNMGADGIQSMIDEAETLGLTINRIDAAKVEIANDAFDRAKKSSSSFGRVLATETAPLVAALSDMWTDSANEAGGFGVVAQNVVQAVAKGIGYLADMGRGLQVSFLLVKQAMVEVGNGAVQMAATVAQSGGDFLRLIGVDTNSGKDLQKFAAGFSATTESLRSELKELLLAPLPSEKIQSWVTEVQTKFQMEAEEAAKSGRTDLSSLLLSETDSPEALDSKTTSLVENARNQYAQIHAAQLEMEGKQVELENARFEREKLRMQEQFDLLREKNAVTAEIEAEYRTAREELEAQHTAKLTDIESERQNKTNAGYSEMLNVAGSYFDGMQGKQAGYARAALSMGQTLLDEEKRNSIASIWGKTYETAMKAYSSLAEIPVVGPALGAAAAGVVIGAGTAYAAKVNGLASYDGGGYTGDGPRIGGVDGKGGMLAVVHPNETVIDHTKGQSSTQKVSVNYHFHGSAAENEQMINDNRNAMIRDARRLSGEIGRPF